MNMGAFCFVLFCFGIFLFLKPQDLYIFYYVVICIYKKATQQLFFYL